MDTPAIYCDAKAIPAEKRARYRELSGRLKAAVREKRSLVDGFGLRLNGIGLVELAEWMSLERRCCPFLSFRLSVDRGREEVELEMTGPPGAKAVLEEAFAGEGE